MYSNTYPTRFQHAAKKVHSPPKTESSKLPFIPNRSLDFGEIARLCHAACFSPSRRRSGLRRGVARIRMRTEAGKMPESLTFPIKNGLGVSNDRFGFMQNPSKKIPEATAHCRPFRNLPSSFQPRAEAAPPERTRRNRPTKTTCA